MATLSGMRNITAALVTLFFTGCLSSAHPAATRAETRFEIAQAIAHDGGAPRSIVEVRRADASSAVVVTEAKTAGARQEERWVKSGDGWQLAGVDRVAAP